MADLSAALTAAYLVERMADRMAVHLVVMTAASRVDCLADRWAGHSAVMMVALTAGYLVE